MNVQRRAYQHRNRFVIQPISTVEEALTDLLAKDIETALIERARTRGSGF
jgi:hypothetical protein